MTARPVSHCTFHRATGSARARAVAITCALITALFFSILPQPAAALEPIVVNPDDDTIEITTKGELYYDRGDRFQVETAASSSGVVGRMSVAAQVAGSNPSWLVFALSNPTGRRIERWLTANRYSIVGSGAVWPDLDARRIEAVTPSIGFLPEQIDSDRADVYRITLEPGQTITYVAELSSERYARIYLWKPLAYELKVRERQLLNGALLGLTGLLAIFLTAIFAANHKAIFPYSALVAWCVLAYLCIEFGFFHKMFNLRPEDNAVYRAAGEASIAASLLLFLYVFLRLGLAHSIIRMLFGVWILAQLALVAIAVIDPRLAATFARLSFFLLGGVGTIATLYLAFRGQDRAIALIPTWIMFIVWIFAAAVTLTGRLSGEVAVASLVSGLVLIVLLIGFTVTQFAFRSLQPAYGAASGDQNLQSLAVDGAGAATWEWNDRRNEVRVSPIIEAQLGLNGGELSTKVDDFINHINPNDRDRFRLMMWSVQERGGGKVRIDFRLRASDNSYRWYELDAACIDTADRRSIRCIGLIRDITDTKRSHERLLHDAVHCSLTGLPNRELFVDRLSVAFQRARSDDSVRPTVMYVDIDKFKSVNDSLGLVVGDSLLLTVARRLQRHLDEHDTLARLGGDKFAILMLSQKEPRALASQAERIRRSMRSPIKIAGREVVLTGSIGIAIFDGGESSHLDLLKEAELAMYRAKRAGADRIEIFSPQMRTERDDRVTIESDLRTALEKNQIKVLFQPIVYLPTEELAGFEALVRWEHPTRGLLNPESFVPVAEESDLIVLLGSYVLKRSVATLSQWQKLLPRADAPLFLSVNISSRQLMSAELVQEVKLIAARTKLRPGSLRLEITESLVMANPEQAVERMDQLRAAGAELALDDFGTGFSSLFYLQRFPVDTIKLDRGFVQGSYDSDTSQSAIVRSMVALAHELGKNVVAEGVEEPRDAAFLRSINCEYAQGFYYGEAMPDVDALELVRIIRKSEHRMQSQGFFRPRQKKSKDRPKSGTKPRPTKKETPIAAKDAKKAPQGTDAKAPPPQRGPATNGAVPKPAPHPPADRTQQPNGVTPMQPPPLVPNAPKPPIAPQANGPAPGAPQQARPGQKPTPGGPAARPTPPNGAPPMPEPDPQRNAPTPPPGPNAANPPPTPPPMPGEMPQRPKQPARTPPQPQNTQSGMPPPEAPPPTNGPGSPPPSNGARGISGLLDGLPPLQDNDAQSPQSGQPPNVGNGAGGHTPNRPGDAQPPDVPPEEQPENEEPYGGLEPAEFSSLPPGIAASLARLAGSTTTTQGGSPRRLADGGGVKRGSQRRKGPKHD